MSNKAKILTAITLAIEGFNRRIGKERNTEIKGILARERNEYQALAAEIENGQIDLETAIHNEKKPAK